MGLKFHFSRSLIMASVGVTSLSESARIYLWRRDSIAAVVTASDVIVAI